MTKEVDLVSYLPAFMADFKEIDVTLEAENPEFVLIWNAAEQVLNNEFIATADEYGISRFEKILNILPSTEDTLESRRSRVFSRWFNTVPYTLRAFISKLETISGGTDFTISKFYDYYRLELETNLELFGQVDELENMINTMIPCNMVVISKNNIPCNSRGFALIAGGIAFINNFLITNDSRETHTVHGAAAFGGGIVEISNHFITNDSKETHVANSTAYHGGGIVNTVTVTTTNDFNGQFSANGENNIGSGVLFTEFVEVNNE